MAQKAGIGLDAKKSSLFLIRMGTRLRKRKFFWEKRMGIFPSAYFLKSSSRVIKKSIYWLQQ